MGQSGRCEPLYQHAGFWHCGRSFVADADGEAVAAQVTDPELPDFAPRRPLSRLPSSEGAAVGVDYEGDGSELLTADERAAFVRAAMERDADA